MATKLSMREDTFDAGDDDVRRSSRIALQACQVEIANIEAVLFGSTVNVA